MARFVPPGRVNLMGDHTDDNEGAGHLWARVLP